MTEIWGVIGIVNMDCKLDHVTAMLNFLNLIIVP